MHRILDAIERKDKKYYLFINIGSFLLLYLISTGFLENVYLFEWTSRNYYLYIWILPILMDLLDHHIRSISISIGNFAGIVIGQIIGDHIVEINKAKISPDMLPGKIEQLRSHPGVWIWLLTVFLFYVAGVLMERAYQKREETTK